MAGASLLSLDLDDGVLVAETEGGGAAKGALVPEAAAALPWSVSDAW